jgi:acetyltransferase-like isoleucine patch superfamily enzyme
MATNFFWKPYKRILKFFAKHAFGNSIRCKLLKMAGYAVGTSCFIGEDLIIKDELHEKRMVKIGDRVAIAERVTLVTVSNPNNSHIRPFINEKHGQIEICDDAWIGTGCIILPHVRIGKGAVVGAGSVVTKSIDDLTIAAGVPARPIKKIAPQVRWEANGQWPDNAHGISK